MGSTVSLNSPFYMDHVRMSEFNAVNVFGLGFGNEINNAVFQRHYFKRKDRIWRLSEGELGRRNLKDLVRDTGLSGRVVFECEILDQILCVVCGALHCDHSSALL